MRKSLYRTLPVDCGSDCGCSSSSSSGSTDTGGSSSTPGLAVLKFVISADGTGTTDPSFDGYKPQGNTLQDNRLKGARIAVIQINGPTSYDYGLNPTPLDPVTGVIDFAPIGGLFPDMRVTIIYTPANNPTP